MDSKNLHPPRWRPAAARAVAWAVLITVITVIAGCNEPPYRAGRGPVNQDSDDGGMPAWVNSPEMDLDTVSGVGADIHHDLERAIIDARHDIAKQLHIVIAGDQRSDEDGDDDDQDSASGRHPRVVVDHLELPGLSVTRKADTPRCLYVQVALSRQAWATGLRQRLGELDAQIAAVQAAPHGDAARPIAAGAVLYQRLLPLLSDREEKIAHLRIADPGGLLPPPPISLSTARENFIRLLDQVSIEVIADPELEAIIPQITGSCTNFGLRVAQGPASPTLRLRLQLRINTDAVDGMIRLEGEFDAATTRGGDGRQLGDFHIQLRSSSQTETVARDRLLRKILGNWTDYLEHEFVNCLTSF